MEQGTETREARSWPTPEAVTGLAMEVVSALGRRVQPQSSVRVSVLDKLITQVLTRGLFDAERVATMMRAQRLSDLETVNNYIPAAARRLGHMWSEDIIGFAEVSIASARLQALSHEISGRWSTDTQREAPQDVTLMIVTLAGEDHTLGAVTLCTLLRRQGLSVDLRLGPATNAIVAELQTGRHDAVLLSCSRPAGLESLARVIKDVRQRVQKTPVLAVGGVVLDHATDIQRQTGADLVTRDINQVLKLAVSSRKGRIALVK